MLLSPTVGPKAVEGPPFPTLGHTPFGSEKRNIAFISRKKASSSSNFQVCLPISCNERSDLDRIFDSTNFLNVLNLLTSRPPMIDLFLSTPLVPAEIVEHRLTLG